MAARNVDVEQGSREPELLRAEIEEVLTGKVGSLLDSHAGAVEVTDVTDDGQVHLTFVGACSHCPSQGVTYASRVLPAVEAIEGVRDVKCSTVNVSRQALHRINRLFGITPQQERVNI